MKKDKKNAMINKILIWNLSASDFLVGVYTMTICVKSVTMQGKYCKEDVEWRSGITCSAIGALLMIGTESSVFTLTIITGFRVYTLLRLSQNPFFSIINKNEIKGLNQWISTIQTENNDTLTLSDSWSALETMLKRLNPKFNIDQKFGYYSTHTVCLPTVFPNPMKDMAWGYSLIFLIFNFLAFFVISVGYFVIYKNSTRENKALTNQQLKERAKSMQKKVTVIIITDLLCWMPICIMGFLQVAGNYIARKLNCGHVLHRYTKRRLSSCWADYHTNKQHDKSYVVLRSSQTYQIYFGLVQKKGSCKKQTCSRNPTKEN
uniref:G-protein coupled receptor GRL101-like isoform X4 n=1 Tax=Styela clava TaxID=7725 RepID=UPI001939DFDA|nr:G-protein coupled receptor GRL101-like isoform X4 [Styela clava]